MSENAAKPERSSLVLAPSGPWTDLGLTLPFFVVYHVGLPLVSFRNAADFMTTHLRELADQSLGSYVGLTLAVAGAYVGLLVLAGRGQALRGSAFVSLAVEGVVYAVAMRLVAGWVTAKVTLGAPDLGAFGGLVMSCGAGFYEEILFRVGLYGLGFRLLTLLFDLGPVRRRFLQLGWAVIAAAVFSGWHYVGALGDPFELRSFVFRWVCGLVFTAIYVLRGFAPAVWTHALYDIWVLVL